MMTKLVFHEDEDNRISPTKSIGEILLDPHVNSSDKSDMTETFQDRVRRRVAELGIKPVVAAKKVGLERTFIIDIVKPNGKKSVRADKLPQLAQALDTSVEYLTFATDDPAPHRFEQIPGRVVRTPPPEPNVDFSKTEDLPNFRGFGGPRDVPVRGTALGGSDEDGDFRFTADNNLGHEPRPPGIMGKRDVYVVYVQNDSMDPKFEPGDRLYVDPHRPPRVMDYVVVELRSEDGESGRGYIKRLVKKTPTRVVVEQFNPRKEIEFTADEVKALHRVIPQDELLGV